MALSQMSDKTCDKSHRYKGKTIYNFRSLGYGEIPRECRTNCQSMEVLGLSLTSTPMLPTHLITTRIFFLSRARNAPQRLWSGGVVCPAGENPWLGKDFSCVFLHCEPNVVECFRNDAKDNSLSVSRRSDFYYGEKQRLDRRSRR